MMSERLRRAAESEEFREYQEYEQDLKRSMKAMENSGYFDNMTDENGVLIDSSKDNFTKIDLGDDEDDDI